MVAMGSLSHGCLRVQSCVKGYVAPHTALIVSSVYWLTLFVGIIGILLKTFS